MISRSVLPWTIMSRTWLRRSCARSACESAMVWFWQTRQRSSEATRITRASSTGSSEAGTASFAAAASGSTRHSASSMRRRIPAASDIQLFQKRHDLLLDHLGRQRPDLLVADGALLVDDEGLRHAVDAVVDTDAAVGIE